jgi:hypothetical protein
VVDIVIPPGVGTMRSFAANPAVILMGLAIVLVGCNSQTSFHDALQQAETTGNCSKNVYRGTAALEARCFSAVDRPVWEKHSPKTVDAYDLWQSRRMAIAKRFDRGEISPEEYRRGNLEALSNLKTSLMQRETSEKADSTAVIAVLLSGATTAAETPAR